MASANDPLPTVRTARDFLEAIRRSDVLPEPQLEKVRDRVRVGRYPGEVPDLARRLIRNGTLTTYQARHLLYGKGEDLAIGRYVILDLIGRGAMGKVYKARHRLMGRIDALKALLAQLLQLQELLATAGVHAFHYAGRVDAFASELDGALGAVTGSG